MHAWSITWLYAVWKRNQTQVPGILRITIYTSTEWLKCWKDMNIDTILSKMEEQRLDELSETQNETEPLLRPESSATYLHFRPGREPQQANRFTAFVLSVFKVTFCSLGLWGHQTWNYIPRVLFSAICIFPTVFLDLQLQQNFPSRCYYAWYMFYIISFSCRSSLLYCFHWLFYRS